DRCCNVLLEELLLASWREFAIDAAPERHHLSIIGRLVAPEDHGQILPDHDGNPRQVNFVQSQSYQSQSELLPQISHPSCAQFSTVLAWFVLRPISALPNRSTCYRACLWTWPRPTDFALLQFW